MRYLISFLIAALWAGEVVGQSLKLDSTRFIDGNKCCTQIRYSLVTEDGGLLFVGDFNFNPGGIIPYFPLDTGTLGNILVGKLDAGKRIAWIKAFGGNRDDYGIKACQALDGGYAILATTESTNGDAVAYKGSVDMLVIRTDANGNKLWSRCYGGSYGDNAMAIAATADSGFILLGNTNSSDSDVGFHYGGYFNLDWVVIKVDKNGNRQWSRVCGGTEDERYYGSIFAIDTCYYLIGGSRSTDYDCTDTMWHAGAGTGTDVYLMKIGASGQLLYAKSFGGSGFDNPIDAQYVPADTAIWVGAITGSCDYMVDSCYGGHDMWALKLGLDGTLKKSIVLGTAGDDDISSIAVDSVGPSLYGYTIPGTISFQDLILYNATAPGRFIRKVFGGSDADFSANIHVKGREVICTGATPSNLFTEGTTIGRIPPSYSGFISYLSISYLSVDDYNRVGKLYVYPNPSLIDLTVATEQQLSGRIVITNALGQRAFEGAFDRKLTIDVGDWTAGVYFLQFTNETGTFTTHFIKQVL